MTTTKPKNPRFEVYPGNVSMLGPYKLHDVIGVTSADWRWRLYARNGEIIASGEGHTSRRDALRAVTAVKRAVLAIDANDACETVAPRASKARK